MIALPPPAPAAAPMMRECPERDLRLSLDAGQGEFSGMSHSGVLVVLRNRGARACTLPGLPRVEALDAAGAALPVERQAPPGMHPGPVVTPVVVRPGAVVSTPLYWVTGPVFEHNRCVTPATLRVSFGAVSLKRPWDGGQICADDPKPATFRQPVLRPGREMSAP